MTRKTLTITLYNNSPDNYAFNSVGYDAAIDGGCVHINERLGQAPVRKKSG